MLEKYLKILFSFNLKNNINILLIILVLLILALLIFGNFNLVEGLTKKTPQQCSGDIPPVGSKDANKICTNLAKLYY